jgi:hypothetical protein
VGESGGNGLTGLEFQTSSDYHSGPLDTLQ